MKGGFEGIYATPQRTKRQQEVLERLEAGMPVKQIATDLGVTRNAVYATIDRLRLRGALSADFSASGQLARGRIEISPGPGGPSRLRELRELEDDPRSASRYAELIEGAISDGDVGALAYELGRSDADGRAGAPVGLIEAALRRRGVVAPEAEAESPRGAPERPPESG